MASVSPIREVSFKHRIEPAKAFGPKPDLRWLEISSLVVDRAYQREILKNGMGSIRRIVSDFKWSRFGTLLVSDRAGVFALVDGQHRAIAAKVLGIPKVPCSIIKAGQEEEALAFAAINGGITRAHGLQIFHAKVAGGDKKARALHALCEDCGVIIPRNPGLITKQGETHSIGALQAVFAHRGDRVLQMTLRAIVGTGDGNIGYLKPAVICGLSDALAERKEWQRSQSALNAVIDQPGIQKLFSTVERIRALDGGVSRKLFARQIVKLFDKASAAKSAVKGSGS